MIPFTGGKHKRGFCAECGSRLTGGEFDERPSEFIGTGPAAGIRLELLPP